MQFCGLCRIFNILPKHCPQESSIPQFLVLPCVCSFLSRPQRWCLAINSCLQKKCKWTIVFVFQLGYSFHSPGTSLPQDQIWTLGFFNSFFFYYTEYCHFKRHIRQQRNVLVSSCSCCVTIVSWLRSLLPFSTHKLWVLSWWCHQKTVITESCKKKNEI